MINKPEKWIHDIESVHNRMWEELDRLAVRYRSEVLLPFCRKRRLRFTAGNGTYMFQMITRRFIFGTASDARRLGVDADHIFEVLDQLIDATPFGSMIEDVKDSD